MSDHRENQLANAVADHLVNIANMIRSGDYENVERYTEISSGGDGWGDANTYIDFWLVDNVKDNLGGVYAEDIGQILHELRKLKYEI